MGVPAVNFALAGDAGDLSPGPQPLRDGAFGARIRLLRN